MQAICASRCRAPVRVCVCVSDTHVNTQTHFSQDACVDRNVQRSSSPRALLGFLAPRVLQPHSKIFFFASAKPKPLHHRQILEKRCNAPVSDKAIKEVCERRLHRRAPALRELSPFSAVFVRTRRTLPSTFASSRHCPPLGVVLSVRISL